MITQFAETAIELAAEKHGLNRSLVEAIVLTESGGDTFATRFEPHYRWLVKFSHPDVTTTSDRNAQKTSWGLMQVMGAVARERGFNEPFLSKLTNPFVGVEYGCRQLRWLFERGYSEMEVISAYNQGRPRRNADRTFKNQGYVDRVVRKMQELS